jgi:outer membrane receptor for ferrienterochelin and colicins
MFSQNARMPCLFLILIFGIECLRAEALSQQNLIAVSESTGLFQDIPSVYSASKYEQKITKAPASISIVTADEIKKYGYRTFGQILSSLRGFYNTSDRAYGYAGARGFGLAGDYNSRLLLLIDGHRYNDNMFDAFDTSEGFPVDIDVIERIEIVRGPSSSLYGTSAVFGVINIITKRGRDQHGVNIKSSYGSNDTHKTSLSAGDRFDNGFEVFATGSFYDSQGFNRLHFEGLKGEDLGLSVGNDGERDRKLMLKAAYGDFSFQGLHLNRNKDVPTNSYDTSFNGKTFNDQATFFELKFDHTFDNQLNLQSRVSYNNYRFKGYLPYSDSTATSFVNSNWWRFEIEASQLLWDDHRVTIGGQYQDNFDQFQTFYNSLGKVESYNNKNSYQWAVFIQDDYRINDQLSLNMGLRYDYYSFFSSTVNPRVALIYNPWENTTFKLLYGEAFRAPNQNELYNSLNTVLANPNLNAEKLDTIEFIIEYYFTRQLRMEFNVFRNYLQDNIVSKAFNAPTGSAYKSTYKNDRNVESVGVEAQIEHSWDDGFQGRLSYSWQDTRDEKTNERLSNSPEHMLKFNLIAPLWRDKVFLGFETQYLSSRRSPAHKDKDGNKIIQPDDVGDYVISNLTVFTQNWIKGLELSAGAYNLFNSHYYDPASADHYLEKIQQDSITFRVKASLDF